MLLFYIGDSQLLCKLILSMFSVYGMWIHLFSAEIYFCLFGASKNPSTLSLADVNILF
jgi:hypothetical protein